MINIQNDLFSFPRFKAYLRKLWHERWRRLALAVGVLFGILLVIEFWVAFTHYYDVSLAYVSTDYAKNDIILFSALICLVGGSISATQMFTDGQQKGGRIHVLTTPVSTLEMWLSRWLIYVLGFVVVFAVCFYVADTLRVLAFSAYPYVRYVNVFSETGIPQMAWYFYPFFVSWFVLGCYFFPKHSILATGVTVFVGAIVFIMLMVTVSSPWYDGTDSQEKVAIVVTKVWLIGQTLLNYWLSCRRLKELEVIDHY